MSAGQLLLTGENAGTKAAFNAAYAAQSNRIAAVARKNAAERNIAAIKQDKILTNIAIQNRQDEAEAFARVNAAASGVQGQSVRDVIYETEKNEAHAIASAKKQSEQLVENELARINNAQAALLSVEKVEISTTGELMRAFSSLELSDFKTSAALQEDGISLQALWGS